MNGNCCSCKIVIYDFHIYYEYLTHYHNNKIYTNANTHTHTHTHILHKYKVQYPK